jgi:hypothetical protein
MTRVKAPDEAAAVSGGVEALASLARGHGSAKASREGVSYSLPRQPAQLPPEDMLIAVVDGETLTVRTVRKPTLRESPAARSVHARYVARRIAEIEGAVREMLARSVGPGGPASESALTDDEERALVSGGFDTSPLRPEEDEPLAQTALEFARLLQSSLSVEQAARVLGVDPSRVRQRLSGDRRTLYGVKEGRAWRVPKFQFAGKKQVPGIGAVVAVLPRDLHPVAVHRWFTTRNPDLHVAAEEDQSVAPLDWLRSGRAPAPVVELARSL